MEEEYVQVIDIKKIIIISLLVLILIGGISFGIYKLVIKGSTETEQGEITQFTEEVVKECIEDWGCGVWNECIGEQKTRTCTDKNNCGSTNNKPFETQSCEQDLSGAIGTTNIFSNKNGDVVNFTLDSSVKHSITFTNVDVDKEEVTLSIESEPIIIVLKKGESKQIDIDGDGTFDLELKLIKILSDGTVDISIKKLAETTKCYEVWECTEWSECRGGDRIRSCTDKNRCKTRTDRPIVSKKCRCTVDWSCTKWLECVDGKQKRTCTDKNVCGITDKRPELIQNCIVVEKPDLAVTDITWTPSNPRAGDEITVSYTIKNVGNSDFVGNISEPAGYSINVICSGATKSESSSFISLKIDETIDTDLTFTMNFGCESTIEVKVDYLGKIDELYEINNILEKLMTIASVCGNEFCEFDETNSNCEQDCTQ